LLDGADCAKARVQDIDKSKIQTSDGLRCMRPPNSGQKSRKIRAQIQAICFALQSRRLPCIEIQYERVSRSASASMSAIQWIA
jgi:hypothetical protein